MALNARNVTVVLGCDDALLLQASLRNYRYTFELAGNEMMTELLDRVEAALERVNRNHVIVGSVLDQVEEALEE
jgi:hypothetical protein